MPHPFNQPVLDEALAADAQATYNVSVTLASPGTLFVVPYYNVGATATLPTVPDGMLNANNEFVDPRGLNRTLMLWAIKYTYAAAAGLASTVTMTALAGGATKTLYTATNTALNAILNYAVFSGAETVNPLKTTASPAKATMTCSSGVIDAFALFCWVVPKP